MESALLSILFVITSHSQMGETGKPTGLWFEELSTPYYLFMDAGYSVQIASIKGGEIPIDPRSTPSEEPLPESVKRFMADPLAMNKIKQSPSLTGLSNFKEKHNFVALYLPGGHGTMWDFPNNKALASLIKGYSKADLVVGAVCHGPAAFLGIKKEDGTFFLSGKRVAGFTNTEEVATGLAPHVPFLLETQLIKEGAAYEKGEDFQPFVVVDDLLVTGQNPASSQGVAERMLKLITKKTPPKQ